MWRENNREYDAARHKKWNEANAEHIKERTKQYQMENAEKRREYRKRYQMENAERLRKKSLQHYYQNRDRYRENLRRWRSENVEHLKQYTLQHPRKDRLYSPHPRTRTTYEESKMKWREYYHSNREYHNQRVMNYFHSHPGYRATIESNRRARKREAGGSYTYQEWQELKTKYNFTCLCCGKQEPEIKLHADHVIPVIKGGSSYIDNIQPLCKPCNSSKGRKFIDFRGKNP